MEQFWDRFASQRMARRRLLKTGAAFSAGAAGMTLLGCSSDDDGGGNGANPTPTSQTEEEVRPGGNFSSVVTSTSAHFNIFANYQEGYQLSGIHVYDRPMTRRLDNRGYVMEAAESVEQTDDLTVVIKLKPDMVFQDIAPANGRAVKASDIVAVQEYVGSLSTAENPGFQRGYLDRAEATDDRTVVYHIKSPFAYLFGSTMLCNPTGQSIAPAELLQGNMEQQRPVGSGAYQLDDYTLNARYLYRKNPTYREAKDGLPYIDTREVLLLSDIVAVEAAYRSNQLQLWYNPPQSTRERLVREMGDRLVDISYLSTSLFIINMRQARPPWNDPRVREAFYRLTNKEQMVDLVFRGQAVAPAGPLHASLEEYQLEKSQTDQYFRNDPAQARQLLEAANFDFNREFEISINNNTNNNTGGEVWQQQLSQAGVKVRPTPIPFAEWLPNRVGRGEFDLIIGGTPGQDTPFRAMRNHHSDTLDVFNHVGLGDPRIDALIEKTETTVDREENIRLVKELQIEVLKLYSGTYNVVTQQNAVVHSPQLRNFELDPLVGQVFRQNWWMAT